MKRKTLIYIFFFTFLISFSLNLAQDVKKPQRLLVMQDVVNANKQAEYEKVQKAMNDFIVQNKLGITWQSFQTDSYTYMYLVPFDNYAKLDTLFELWNNKMKTANQDELKKHVSGFIGNIDQTNALIVQKDESSYTPKTPYLKPEDAKFIHWDFFEVIPGKENESWALMAEYKKLCEKSNINVAFNAWSINFGEKVSTIIVTTLAKDDVDFYAQNKSVNEKLMKEKGAGELFGKFMSNVKKYEHFNGKPRPDLSISAMK